MEQKYLIWAFRQNIKENDKCIRNKHSQTCQSRKKFKQNQKFRFGTKTSIISMHIAQNLQKVIAIFEISTLEFSEFQRFVQKEKYLNLHGCFWQHFRKTIAIFEINILEFRILESLNLGLNMPDYFWVEI